MAKKKKRDLPEKKNRTAGTGSRGFSGAGAALRSAWPFLAGILFFLAVCLCYNYFDDRLRTVALAATIVTVVITAARARTLLKRISLPLCAVTLYIVVDGISALYSAHISNGTMALYTFLVGLDSYCIALSFTALAPGEGKEPGRWLGTVLAGASAIIGLLSIDLISTRYLSGPVLNALSRFVPDYVGLNGLEPGTRMTSIFVTANIFAGIEGVGVLISLGLLSGRETGWRRYVTLVILYVNALAFLLSVSMGATAMIVLAFVVYLILEGKRRRGQALVLMLETFLFTMIPAMIVSQTSLDVWTGVDPVPDLCLAAGAAGLCLTDRFVGRRLETRFSKGSKLVPAVTCGVILFLAAYAAVGVTWTGGATLSAGERLHRAAYPEPGEYTMKAESEGELNVVVVSQNRQEAMMHTESVLYTGALEGASFTVPEDSMVVYFDLYALTDARIGSVVWRGNGEERELPLKYRILPGFIANRIQGLLANENAIQRMVFFEDGMKLFAMRPLFGWGLSGFENNFGRTQSFYYTTRYVHNHYIEVLIDKGVVGLAVFLLLLLTSGAAVILELRRGEERSFMAPALGAALVFMAGHAAVEVIFSAHQFLPFGYGTFMLIGLVCGDALRFPKRGTKASDRTRWGLFGAQTAALLVFAALVGLNTYSARLVKRQNDLEAHLEAIGTDPFERTNYIMDIIRSAASTQEGSYARNMGDRYAAKLESKDDYRVSICLAEYYFRIGKADKGLEFAARSASQAGAVEDEWRKVFELLGQYYDGSETFREGILQIAGMMDRWNEENLGELTLEESTQKFIEGLG